MRHRTAFGAALVSSLLLSCAAFAQDAKAPAKQITLNVVVTPDQGQPVAGLTQNDFTVLDNKAPRPISSFRALTSGQTPTPVLLVIDAVNTPHERLAYEREQLDNFLSANDGHLAQPTALAIVSDSALKVQPGFTRDGTALRKTLDSYNIAYRAFTRSAGFYGANERLQISIKALSHLAAREAAIPGRKLIVYVSPGWPLLDSPSLDLDAKQKQGIFDAVVALSTQLREARVTLDAVNPLGAGADPGYLFYFEQFLPPVKKSGQAQFGNLGLQVLAEHSGGLVLNANNDIAGLLHRCVSQTGATYEISFEAPPPEGPNAFHQIGVKLARSGLVAHTEAGYYANPEVAGNQLPSPSAPH